MVVTTLRIEREKLARFKELAALEHRTSAQEIRALIDARIAQHDAAQADQLKDAA